MATKDFFSLIREGNANEIRGCIRNLRDLTAIETVLNLVDAVGKDNMTALHHAARYGHLQLVQLLLSKGAEINAKSKDGLTALHWSCICGRLEVTKELLAQGADFNSKNNDNYTPLDCCRSSIKLDVERFLSTELPTPSPPIYAEIAELRTRLAAMTRERDATTATITALNISLTDRTKHRDDLLYQRTAFEMETKNLWEKLLGSLKPLSVVNSKASVYINCLASVPDDVSVETALVTHADKALFCKLKETGEVDESTKTSYLQSIRDHKERGVSIEGRSVPATNSLVIPGVSDEQKLAIRMYTVQMPKQYFLSLNRALNADIRTPDVIREMKLYMRVLIRGLQALSLVEDGKYVKRVSLAYRGLKIKDNEFYRRKVQVTMTLLGHHLDIPCAAADTLGSIEPFRVGEPITFSAFTSISLNSGTMDDYSDHLIYEFHDVVGLDIRSLSAYPGEDELLLPPPSLFEIIALTPMPNKKLLEVHLKQMPPDASYLRFSPFPAVPHDHNLRQIFADESRRPVLESSRLQELEDEVRRLREAAATATAGRNLTAAYDILSTALDTPALSQLLAEEGISRAEHLDAVTAEEVQQLAAHLKKIPRRIFLKAMGVVQ